jgi:hypothetical protein
MERDLPLNHTMIFNAPYDKVNTPPADDYFIACKYQSDLSKTPRSFHLMLLGVGTTVAAEVDYNSRYFRSENFTIDGYAS